MTTSAWLTDNTSSLKTVGIETARLDCLVLLEDIMLKDRSWLLAHPEEELTSQQVSELTSLIERRTNHEPLAYIRGKSEFYGREYIVTPNTLQPRAETETMIDQLKKILDTRPQISEDKLTIVDVGTGSGCLAISAKLERPETEVYATEIQHSALLIAERNAKNMHANITFLHGNLLEPFYSEIQDLRSEIYILANLPYVPNNHTINKAAMQEPAVAIFGGDDGLDLYREMFGQISDIRSKISVKPVYIFTESLPFQHESLDEIAKKHGYTILETQDFIQVFTAS